MLGPLTNLVEYEWRQLDSEACPHEYCGPPSKEREDAWKWLWDRKLKHWPTSVVDQRMKLMNVAVGWMSFPRGSLSTLNKSPQDSWLHPVHPLDENALVAMPECNSPPSFDSQAANQKTASSYPSDALHQPYP